MIIQARKLLPISSPPIDYGAVVILNSKIIDIGTASDIRIKYPDEKIVDMGDGLVMPGLVNLHAHIELSYLKNRTSGSGGFFDWIASLVEIRLSRKYAENIDECCADALRTAVRTGTTCIADISSTEVAMPYLLKSGIKAMLYLEILGMDDTKAEATFTSLINRLNGINGLSDRLTAGISPHSLYSTSPKLFNMLRDYTSCNDLHIATHISEIYDEILFVSGQPSGVDWYLKAFGWDGFEQPSGSSPADVVSKYGMGPNWILAHCVNLIDDDFRIIKDAGASVAFCPRSNAFLGVGKAQVESLVQAGINVGIGTDSLASNISIDLWDEMRFALVTTKLSATDILRMATANGARALGITSGTLEPGSEADIIAIRTAASQMDDPYATLLTDTQDGDIIFTMVNGKAIYSRNGATSYDF